MAPPEQATTDPAPHAGPTPAPPALSWAWVKATVKRLGPAGPLAVMSMFPPVGGFVLIGYVKSVAPWLKSHGAMGLLAYVGGFVALASLSLIPTYACSIVGGWTFGFWVGLAASMTAFCLAALSSYWINRGLAGTRVVDIIKEHPKWEAVCTALIGSGFWRALLIITLIRVPPTSPFALANFIFGAARAPVVPYLLGTAIGMAPRTAAVVWAAAQLSDLDFKDVGGVWMLAGGIVATLVVVAVVGAIANRAIRRITGAEPKAIGQSA